MGNDISFLKRYEYSRIFSFLEQILFFLEYSELQICSFVSKECNEKARFSYEISLWTRYHNIRLKNCPTQNIIMGKRTDCVSQIDSINNKRFFIDIDKTDITMKKMTHVVEGDRYCAPVYIDRYVLCFCPKELFRYDIITKKWSTVPHVLPKEHMLRMSIATFNNKIIMTGGYTYKPSVVDVRYQNAAYIYCEKDGTWVPQENMTLITPRYRHQSIEYMGKFFVLGGYAYHPSLIASSPIAKVEVFDPLIGKFVDTPPMKRSRDRFSVIIINDILYVIGGDMFDIIDCYFTIEKMDPKTLEWEIIVRKKICIKNFSVVHDDSRIYFLGGNPHVSSINGKPTWNYYDLSNDTWGSDLYNNQERRISTDLRFSDSLVIPRSPMKWTNIDDGYAFRTLHKNI